MTAKNIHKAIKLKSIRVRFDTIIYDGVIRTIGTLRIESNLAWPQIGEFPFISVFCGK